MDAKMTRRAFVGAAALALTGCAGTRNAADEPAAEPAAETEQAPVAEPEQTSEAPSTTSDVSTAAAGGSTLVVYYSRADENYANGGKEWLEVGHTKVMAGYIAEALGADQYEIVPVEAYPEGYDECCDVAMQEQRDDARPAIANALPDLTPYHTVFIGCPIWWGYEPMIVRTFLEGVDLTGKVVVPFTTHGGSGLGSVPSNVANFAAGADVREGYAVAGTAVDGAHDEVVAWATGLNLA